MIKQLAALIIMVIAIQLPIHPALASFSNSVSSSSSITAATLGAPLNLTLAPNGNPLNCLGTLTWTPASGIAAGGWVVQTYLSGTPIGSPQTLIAGTTTLLSNTLSLLVPYTWKVHATLGNWVSPDATYTYSLTSGCL